MDSVALGVLAALALLFAFVCLGEARTANARYWNEKAYSGDLWKRLEVLRKQTEGSVN